VNILGIILVLYMPLAIGCIFDFITRQKKANQIETYLIGFFSFFLMQGVIFSLYNFVHIPFETCCRILTYSNYGIAGLSIIVLLFKLRHIKEVDFKKLIPRKNELVVLGILLLAILVVIARIVSIYNYERNDIMLDTVRVNVLTNTVNTYNPLTNRPYELGLINSKKLVTMPLLYTYWCITYGIDARVLLYFVCTFQTLFCIFMACKCATTGVLKTKRKRRLCLFFVAVLLASGDYFAGAIGYRVLWNGYDGATIVAAVMMAYVIYLVMYWYRLERGDYGKKKIAARIVLALRLLICLCSTLFLTGLATGALLIILCLGTMIVCATLRFGKEENHDRNL